MEHPRDRHAARPAPRAAALALLTLLAGACAEPEAPPSEVASHLPDPDEPGLPPLARVSRYLYAEMDRRAPQCGGAVGGSQQLEYAIEVVVGEGRIVDAQLRSVSAQMGEFTAPLLRERWPPELVAMVDCLRPHLRALRPAQPLPDGTWVSRFSVGAPRPAPTAPASGDDLDPAEPGLPGLVRTARYVFREMRRPATGCALANPGPDALSYTFEVEVRDAKVVRAELVEAHWQRGGEPEPLPAAEWPAELVRYAACLEPHLMAMALDPAPEDGVYRPDYVAPPQP